MVIVKNKWSSHSKRIFTALLGIPILVILIAYGNLILFGLFICICTLFGLREFYQLLAECDIHCFRILGLGLGLLVSLGFLVWPNPFFSSMISCVVILTPFVVAIFRTEDLSHVIPKLLGTIVGVFYVAWLLSHLILIRGLSDGRSMIFYLLLIVFAGDTAAFYTGMTLGKHRLAPGISPKKSIEGAIGGMLGSILIAGVAHFTFLKQIGLRDVLLLGFILNLLGQLGDLAESMLKRGAGIKDSGTLIPGHGGILDRLDSILFAGPALFYYATIYLHRV